MKMVIIPVCALVAVKYFSDTKDDYFVDCVPLRRIKANETN
jgi:hypothetical protein